MTPSAELFVLETQILSAYFVVLRLREEGAISLGLDTLRSLFAGSLLLTVVAAPIASLAFSLPSIPKPKVRPSVPPPFPSLGASISLRIIKLTPVIN